SAPARRLAPARRSASTSSASSSPWTSPWKPTARASTSATSSASADTLMAMAETTEIRVPFLDLGAIHGDLKEELLESFSALIDSGAFINGPAVREFEDAFADYVGTSTAVGLASGLDALRLGLLAAGLEPGHEVIVPDNTFVATLEAVTQAGGRPVPVQ